jgi:hypothetical protein
MRPSVECSPNAFQLRPSLCSPLFSKWSTYVPEGEDRYPSTPMQTSLQMQFLTQFRYHWALMIGPKGKSDGSFGVRHHAKDRIFASGRSEWRYDECRVTLKATSMLLVRVPAGEVSEMGCLVDIFRDVPVVPNGRS